ncbi:MAG: polysaccharide biosynthesis/export family protein [Acidobacteriaceae bacterium]|nr:polysaccharide biosynthesis/export family protein [Acidobacteriaceae bacterium]
MKALKMNNGTQTWSVLGLLVWGSLTILTTVLPAQEGNAVQSGTQSPSAANSPTSAPRASAPSESSPAVAVSANYRIEPNDVLDIRVFREPDLNTVARVANDGTIMVPLAGQLRVGGLSINQAAKEIQARLAAGYLPNPQVTVNITQFHHRRFTILGQVARSGTYEFPDEGSLGILQALGLAGGYTSIADPSKITIRRTAHGKITTFRVNAKKLAAGQSNQEILVMPGDVITVPESIF